MANDELEDTVIVPIVSETEAERRRIRLSNARDQQLERDGKAAPHNQGYDEVADLKPTSDPTPVAEE